MGKGDVVYIPPNMKHWHGASPRSFMIHLVATTGKETKWENPVKDEEYAEGFE